MHDLVQGRLGQSWYTYLSTEKKWFKMYYWAGKGDTT
jgi:hypothetical protein